MRRQRNKPQPLSDEQLREAAPCDIVRQALPKELAEELLTALLVDAPGWARGQWIMFGKTHDAPRTSCFYSLADSASEVITSSFCTAVLLVVILAATIHVSMEACLVHACGKRFCQHRMNCVAAGAGCRRLQGCICPGGAARGF